MALVRRFHYTHGYNRVMRLTCNIDAKGKFARLISGILVTITGIILLFAWAIPYGGWLPWTITLFALAMGAFQIFEARAGWCVMRAMGFKMPM